MGQGKGKDAPCSDDCRASSLLLFPTFSHFSYFFLLLIEIPTFSYFSGILQVLRSIQGIKSPTFSHSATFPTFDCNCYFLYLSRILVDFKVDAILSVFCQSMFFLGWWGWGVGGQVTWWYLSLGQERSPWFLFAWRNLSGIMGPFPGCRVWDRYSLVTRALPSWPTPILGLEDVWVWVSLSTESVKSQQKPCAFFPGLKNFKVHRWMETKGWLLIKKD